MAMIKFFYCNDCNKEYSVVIYQLKTSCNCPFCHHGNVVDVTRERLDRKSKRGFW